MQVSERQIIDETRRFFQKVYGWMFCGLLISGLAAYYVAFTPQFNALILGNKWVFYGIIVFQLILVFSLFGLMSRISGILAVFLFFVYSFATGLTLSVIFLAFTISSIALTFFITAAMFGLMSLFGFFTKADLTGVGHLLLLGLFGIVIASVVNFFMKNSILDSAIAYVGVVVFAGLAAYDTQKIKKLNIIGNEGTDEDLKESVLGALSLYLDYINLFLSLLRLFGKKR